MKKKPYNQISAEELVKVSYIKPNGSDGMYIPLFPRYLGNSNWEFWLPTETGLLPMKIVDLSEGCYFSDKPARTGDIYLGFVSLIIKRAYFKDLEHFERGILEDINNLSASITKINLFHEIWKKDNNKISRRFITTEIEYIFKVCRSLFDLLQEVIAKIWSRFHYYDTSRKVKQLKQSFSGMILGAGTALSANEIATKHLIPLPLAEFYERNSKFFLWLREYRDGITHKGNSIELLFILDEGFAVSTKNKPFKDLPIWETSEVKRNDLGSVRSVVSYAILNTLHVLEDFSSVIQKIMILPPDIAPGYSVYIRGENLNILNELHTYVEEGAWV